MVTAKPFMIRPMNLEQEIEKRKTFAIISHPDAGKTTLTEKFLLFGGAIKTAGAVKQNKIKKTATSDFMEIEKQRGISVATSVMGFEYKGKKVNILDTPGHKDFAEDTYRTLTAVDSVILVVDSVKGVEAQTERLMEVCRMRNTPVIIFVNKMDREGRNPFEILDELEDKLQIQVRPLTWPISQGQSFQGVYNLYRKQLNLFEPDQTKITENFIEIQGIDDPELDRWVPETFVNKLREDVELIEGVYEPFNKELYLGASLAPVFFGSAVNNFGVREMLETFLDIAPRPHEREASERIVKASEKALTGFVFKIHANLDPNHRDRTAFFKICSGKFERNTFYYHTRLGKKMRFANPTQFMANEKNLIEDAWPGDVIGLYDNGNLIIGDTLTEGEELQFRGIPASLRRFSKRSSTATLSKPNSLKRACASLPKKVLPSFSCSTATGKLSAPSANCSSMLSASDLNMNTVQNVISCRCATSRPSGSPRVTRGNTTSSCDANHRS